MSPPRTARRAARPSRHKRHLRRRRLALLVVALLVALGTLLVTAFGGNDRAPAPIAALASASRLLPAGPPTLEPVARVGPLTLDLPVNQSRITAIGYYASDDGALGLDPVGSQANQGLLKRLVHDIFGGGSGSPRWYQLPGGEGPSNSALDVGAPPGTDVYAPVSGTVVGIEKTILNGRAHGERVDIQPTTAPSLVVTVGNIAVDPSLAVGATVTLGSSKLGELIDLSKVETQSLARYTNDAGNHVLVEVHPTVSLSVSGA
jgi:hypothetical protein